MPEDFEGEGPEDLNLPPSFFPYGSEDADQVEPVDHGELIPVQVEGVFRAESGPNLSYIVVLTDGERRVPIVIGPYEAHAIILPLEGNRPDRPMTHDLLKTLADRANMVLDRVVIDDLWSTTYYAKLFFKRGKEEMEIDARPSDAIAFAVRSESPIFVAEGILEQATEN